MAAKTSSWQPDALMGAARKAVRFDDRWLKTANQPVFQSHEAPAAAPAITAAAAAGLVPMAPPDDAVSTPVTEPSGVPPALPALLDDVAEALSDFDAQARSNPDSPDAGSAAATPATPDGASLSVDGEVASNASAAAPSDAAWIHLGERMASALEALVHNPEQQFEPLKKLALHLACELVRSELHTSPHAIDALVRHCLDSLSASGQSVVVELHPEDARMAQGWVDQWPAQAQVKEDPALSRGSVRVSGMGTVVEDLIENRLQNLARSLGVETLDLQAADPSSGEVVDA